jgi:hypothetical protein
VSYNFVRFFIDSCDPNLRMFYGGNCLVILGSGNTTYDSAMHLVVCLTQIVFY